MKSEFQKDFNFKIKIIKAIFLFVKAYYIFVVIIFRR